MDIYIPHATAKNKVILVGMLLRSKGHSLNAACSKGGILTRSARGFVGFHYAVYDEFSHTGTPFPRATAKAVLAAMVAEVEYLRNLGVVTDEMAEGATKALITAPSIVGNWNLGVIDSHATQE